MAQRSSWGSNRPARRKGYRVLRYWADTHDGTGYRRRCETVRGTKRDGWSRLAELHVLHADDRPTMTVGHLWEAYERPSLAEAVESGRTSPRTFAAYEREWRANTGPRWASVQCTDVKPIDIQEWLLGMTKSAGNIAKNVLKLTLDHAVLLDLIQSNPADRRYRLGRDTAREKFAYTVQQVSAALSSVRGTPAEAPAILSAMTGMRVGEACGVALSDIEWRDGCAVVSIRRQLTARGDVTERLKTPSSRRTVAVGDPWASRLKEIADGLPEGAVYLNDNGVGEPVPRRTVTGWWKKMVEGSGVPYQPMQALRPSYQTNLHWSGVPIEMTSKILGHASTSTTVESYDRPREESLVRVMLDAARKAEEAANDGDLGKIG